MTSFVKKIAAILVLLTIVLAISILLSYPMYTKSAVAAQNKTSSSLPSSSSINQVQGTLIVTKKVINEAGSNKKPSDFTINIHGNDPSPSSFPGSSSGTIVKLHTGMYSVTETGHSNYHSTLSGDCSGGMMSMTVTKNCTITNIISKPIVNTK